MPASSPPTLYLDTSDLSYLVKGRGPGGAARVQEQRTRLSTLITEGRVRLYVSLVHLAEMAIDSETRRAAHRWLGTVSPVWCFTTGAEKIFRAELLGQELVVDARVLTTADLDELVVPTRLGFRLSGTSVALFINALNRGRAAAQRTGRSAERRDRDAGTTRESARAVKRLLQGDLSWMPLPVRPFARSYLKLVAKLARHGIGLSPEDLARQGGLAKHGLGWVAGIVEPGAWPRPSFVAPSNAGSAPACALRAAVEQREAKDLGRNPASSTYYDVQHLAYVAYCDFATLDSMNFDATKKVRRALERPTIVRAGRLAEVLGLLDHDTHP